VIPRSISATALNVADQCLARYKAENIERAPRGRGGDPALLGTTVHGALEVYVKMVYLEKTQEPNWDLLRMLYMKSYKEHFGEIDSDSDWYKDGEKMLEDWFERTTPTFEEFDVISCEVKSTFDVTVPDSAGTPVTVPFNYIWDRVDRLKSGGIRVVDYKSQRWAWSPEQLKTKPQARLYGLAAQIEYPAAEEIWVEFDFLRHGDFAVVGVRYTKEDNKATWLWLKQLLKRIVDVDDAAPYDQLETINEDCRWCVRKGTCSALARSMAVGGTASMPLPSLIDRRRTAADQIKALKQFMEEADNLIQAAARDSDIMELRTDHTAVSFGQRNLRAVDADRAEKILGPELWAQYGKKDISLGVIDELLKKKNMTLTEDQKRDLRSIIAHGKGEPFVVTKPV
jgi:RecB family exonuclease